MSNIEINNKSNGLELKDIFKIIFNYKWFILFSIIISSIITSIYLYFQPVTYSSYGSLEVITYDKNNLATDDLLENTFYSMGKEVDKEIEKLKTYKSNKKVIESMNLGTQIFKEGKYGKKIELFGKEIPIEITNIKNIKSLIYGRMIKIIPNNNGFYLKIEPSLKEKFLHLVFKKTLMDFDKKILFPYNQEIKTKYFTILVKKKKEFQEPLYFKLHGDSYYIYENFVLRKLKIEQPNKNAPIIKISYEDNIPERATLYVNKLISSFIEEGRINKTKRNENISKFIKEGLKENSKELKKAEKKLERYKVKNKIIKTSVQADYIIKKLSDLEVKISENNFQEIVINNILQELRRSGNFSAIIPLLKRLNAQAIIDYIISLDKLKEQESELSAEYTDEYPKLINLRRDIRNLENNIYSSINTLKKSILFEKNNLYKLKVEKEKEFKRLPGNETNIVNLERKYKILLKMNDYLLEKDKENDIIKAAITSDYNIVEEAYLPERPIKPKRSLIQILALILGFIVGIILALLHHNLSNKIIGKEDIEKNAESELSGIIPFVKKYKNRENIGVFLDPQSDFSESFRKLRMDLQFSTKENKSSIFLVSSMLSKEGKSFVLSNLSAVFQLAGYRSIIIDLNLRNPILDKYFDINYDFGMSEYLGGKVDISDIIFSTAYPHLDIIPAGSIPINPSELILSRRVEVLLKKLKEKYDYIFIDTFAIELSLEVLTLMQYSDINIIVIRKDYSKKSFILKLKKLIIKYNLKNIKFVMNASRGNETC